MQSMPSSNISKADGLNFLCSERQLAHEQLAHHGFDVRGEEGRRLVLDELRGALADAGASMDFVRDSIPAYDVIAERMRQQGRSEQDIDDMYLEEFVARTAEKVIDGETLSVEEQTFWDRVVEWIRTKIGLGEAVDPEEVSRVTAVVVRELARGLQDVDGGDVSRGGAEAQRERDPVDDESADDIPWEWDSPSSEPDVSPEPNSEPVGIYDKGRFSVQKVEVSKINADPRRFQYKRDVNESGEQKELKGDWNDTAAGIFLLWEANDGTLYVANGHHRLAHAKRMEVEWVNAQILRESDGWTDKAAFAKAAEDNILDGKGTIYDSAEFFRQSDQEWTEELASQRGLNGDGFVIGKYASENVYTTFLSRNDGQGNEVNYTRIAGIVKGARENQTAQDVALLRVSEKGLTILELQQYASTVAASMARGDSPISSDIEMGDLFGDAEDETIRAWEDQQKQVAAETARMLRETRDELRSVEGTVKTDSRVEKAKKAGVRVKNVDKARSRVEALKEREAAILRADPDVIAEAEERISRDEKQSLKFSLDESEVAELRDSEGRLVAPNGQPSNLNERQWKQVRTPSFKRWFGDWELLQARDFMFDGAPVGSAARGVFSGRSKVRDEIVSYFQNSYGGKIESPVLGDVLISKRSIKDDFGHKIRADKTDAFQLVPDIIQKGVLIDSQKNWKNRRSFDSYVIGAPVELGGDKMVGIVIVRSIDSGKRLYLHDVFLRENLEEAPEAALRPEGQNQSGSDSSGDILGLMKRMAAVNPDEVSKVVDENGEPLVVYHGSTMGAFSVFVCL